MSNLFNEFENRFTNEWFSCGWSEEVVAKPAQEKKVEVSRKDLTVLQSELEQIQQHIENIAQKQLRLSNLAKLYEN